MIGHAGPLATGLLAIGAAPIVGAVAPALLLLTVVPSRARHAPPVTCIFLLVLAPAIAIGWGLSLADREEPLAWLALVPITITWLAILDLRWGVSGRVTRGLPTGATKKPAPKTGGGPDAAP